MRHKTPSIRLVEHGPSNDFSDAYFGDFSNESITRAAAILAATSDRIQPCCEVDRVQSVLAALSQAAIETRRDNPEIPGSRIQVHAGLIREIARFRGVE